MSRQEVDLSSSLPDATLISSIPSASLTSTMKDIARLKSEIPGD